MLKTSKSNATSDEKSTVGLRCLAYKHRYHAIHNILVW